MLEAAICGGVDIGRRQVLRGAEIGVHGALAVRRHQDVGAAGGGAVRRGLGFERDAGGADIVGIEPADLVVLDLADIGGARAEIGDADDGVGRRTAGHFRGRAHVLVDRGGARLVDQRHAALGHAVAAEKGFIGLHQDVENRIADPENVIFCVSHLTSPVCGIERCGLTDRLRQQARRKQDGASTKRHPAPSCLSMIFRKTAAQL